MTIPECDIGEIDQGAGMEQRHLPAVHCTIIAVDVEGFGDRRRTNTHQVAVRVGLYQAVRQTFDDAGVSWDACRHEDRGDGVFILAPPEMPKATFVEAVPDALVAALRGHNAKRPSEERIRLRMSLHAGEVVHDEHGVTGASVNLAFRLLEAKPLKMALTGSPGVLALITSDWFFDEVVRHSSGAKPTTYRPVRVTVKETSTVGWISLPDHPYPPDGSALTAPPPAEPARPVPRQLPAAPRSFIGRVEELDTLNAALATAAGQGAPVVISAIAGSGGIGKTWLALHWAHQHADRFPDGQLFVDLRGFSPDSEPMDSAVAVRGFLDALGLDPAQIPTDPHAQVARYRSLVAGKRMLIVLDNAVDVGQVEPLLPGGTTCQVVVTSRNRLTGLIIRHGSRSLRLGVLDIAQARELLASRLGPRRVEAEAAAVAELVELCGGFPLALGIVAARAQSDPGVLLAEYATELRLSIVDALNDSEPTASLSAVLALSYRKLTTEQRRVLTLLGTAPGADIALPAVAALTGLSADVTRTTLRILHDASLVDRRPGDRYAMHDLIRAHARDRQAAHVDSVDLDRALDRMADFYRRAAFKADKLIRFEDCPTPVDAPFLADRAAALGWLRAEQDNLAACLDDLAARSRTEQLVELTASLATFWRQENPGEQAADRHHRVVDVCRDRSDIAGEAEALIDLGQMRTMLGGYGPASRAYTRAEKLFASLGDHVGLATTLNCLGNLRQRTDDHWGSVSLYERALELYQDAGHRRGEARALANLGGVRQVFGEYPRAIEYLEQAAARYRELGDEMGQAEVLLVLGRVEEWTENHEAATALYREALRLHEKLENRAGQAHANLLLGGVGERSTQRYARALELFRELGNRHGEGNTLCQLADERSKAREYEEAERAFKGSLQRLR